MRRRLAKTTRRTKKQERAPDRPLLRRRNRAEGFRHRGVARRRRQSEFVKQGRNERGMGPPSDQLHTRVPLRVRRGMVRHTKATSVRLQRLAHVAMAQQQQPPAIVRSTMSSLRATRRRHVPDRYGRGRLERLGEPGTREECRCADGRPFSVRNERRPELPNAKSREQAERRHYREMPDGPTPFRQMSGFVPGYHDRYCARECRSPPGYGLKW